MLSYIKKNFVTVLGFIFRKKKTSSKRFRLSSSPTKKAISHNVILEKRIFIISIAQFGFFGILLSRLFYLQIMKGSDYKLLSDKNRISIIFLYPPRGRIIDASGKIIADNKRCFNLLLSKKDYFADKSILQTVFDLLKIDGQSQGAILNKIKNSNPREKVLIIQDMSWEQIVKIEENRNITSKLKIENSYSRIYLYPELCSPFTGYVGLVSEADKKDLENTEKENRIVIGKSGVEKIYEHDFAGNLGYRQIEVNAYGTEIREIKTHHGTVGKDIQLTIDLELQDFLYKILNREGSAAVMDVRTGAIKAICSFPSFDPNIFTKSISHDDWDKINKNKTLFNKVIQGQYSPGSLFKIITILAGLESSIPMDAKFFCGDAGALDSHFHCWKKGGHGLVTSMDQAIKFSCNHYMYNIAKKINPETIIDIAKKFGFGSRSEIDLPFEAGGFIPDKSWKYKKFRDKWRISDSLNMSIGQGFTLCTTIQLLRFMAAIANGGYLVKPFLNIESTPEIQKIGISEEHLSVVKLGIYNVVNTPGGTAYASRIHDSNIIMAGKTSTVQVISKRGRDLSSVSVRKDLRNHGIFCGYAPYENPKYAITVFADHGGSGSGVAAPIARDVLSWYMKKGK